MAEEKRGELKSRRRDVAAQRRHSECIISTRGEPRAFGGCVLARVLESP